MRVKMKIWRKVRESGTLHRRTLGGLEVPPGCQAPHQVRSSIMICNDRIPTLLVGKKERTCDKCYQRILRRRQYKRAELVFRLAELTIGDLRRCLFISKEFHYAAVRILSTFREIQYQLPSTPLNKRQKKILWTNRELLAGSSPQDSSFMFIFLYLTMP